MLMVLLVQSVSATQFECNQGYEASFYGVLVEGVCLIDAEPSGTLSDAWETPERAEEWGTWTKCQEGGSQVVVTFETYWYDNYRHTWRYDEHGVLSGECESGASGDYVCCEGTTPWVTSHWRVGTLEECTPVPVPDEGCDHSGSLGSSSALALALAALLRRGASAEARRTGPC